MTWKIMSWTSVLTVNSNYLLSQIAMLVWPSSIFLMASENQSVAVTILVIAISVSINVALYTFIGVWTWYGVIKHKWLLIPLVILMIVAWYKLLHV